MNLLKITLASIFAATTFANAQVSDECKKNASLGIEAVKIKNYAEAEPYLLKVRKDCPRYNLSTYVSSERLLKAKLKKAPSAEKQTIAKELIALWNERKQYFPAKTKDGDLYSDIAQVMTDNKMGTKEEQFDLFDKAYKSDKANFVGPKKMYTYFGLLVGLQEEGKKEVQEVFDTYDDLSDKIEVEQTKKAKLVERLSEKEESGVALLKKEARRLKQAENSLKIYGQVEGSIERKLGKLADCPNLLPMIEAQYTANASNLEWVKSSAKRLYKKECTEAPLFLKLVEKQHSIEPSAATANYLGKLAEQRGEHVLALKYYEEAAELYEDPNRRADVYANIAHALKKKGSYGQARKYYRKAIKNKPSYGLGYIQIANMIASSANKCGSDEFNKRAVYWLAANYARKAKRVQPSQTKYADKLIANYMGSAPSKTDVFQKGMQGKTIAIGCWIGESVRVPNL